MEVNESKVEKKSYLVTGGSGFIGRQLCQRLVAQGHRVVILTRDCKKTASLFNGELGVINHLQQIGSPIDVVINLAGEPLAGSRWDDKTKASFIDSRVSATKAIGDFINAAERKPSVLINGSAIGFYGLRGNEVLGENDKGTECFSHTLCRQWEKEALKIEKYGVRVCLLRTGIVLGKGGGPLASFLPPFRLGLGGRFGHGQQWMSWVHIEDLIRIIFLAIENKTISGPINGVSPNPVTNQEFSKTLARVLKRPAIFPMPASILRLLVGEMAEELIINGQLVIPEKAISQGYKFKFPELEMALQQII